MAVYRTVHLSFWTDPKVDDEFTPEDKYFYLYLLTNPHTNICGCYELGEKQCSRETGYNTETISRLLDRFQKVHDVIRYDSKTKEVLILNWYKYNWTKSDDLLKSVTNVASHIKSDEFKGYILSLVNGSSKTVPTPSKDPVETSVTVTDTVSDPVTDTVADKNKESHIYCGFDLGERFGYNEFLLEAVEDWLEYKKSRRESYKEIALKSLLTQIQNRVNEYGEDAVVNAIRDSMAANYKGIIWDKLKQQSKQSPKSGYSAFDILRREQGND